MPLQNIPIRTWQRWALAVAIAGVAVCAAAAWDKPSSLWRAYLAAYMACWPVTLGAAGLLAIGNLTGGRWATAARPFYLSAARTIPLVAILFIPIALSIEQIFPWADGSSGEHPLPPGKAIFLSSTFFLWRAAGYIAVWLVVVGLLNWVSRLAVPPGSTPAMRRIGALSLVLLAPTATFAAFDWGMSLEPEWYSSIYGAIVIAGGVLAAHALSVCSLVATRETHALVERAAVTDRSSVEQTTLSSHAESNLPAEVYNDLGNLLLAFLMVFGYFMFSQFLIIWSGNLPSEISWYLRRLTGGWQVPSLLLVLLEFIAFFMLLSRDRKRTPRRLAGIAVVLLAAYAIHNYWMIVPAFPESGLVRHLANLGALAALAGGWVAAFCWHAARFGTLPSTHMFNELQ